MVHHVSASVAAVHLLIFRDPGKTIAARTPHSGNHRGPTFDLLEDGQGPFGFAVKHVERPAGGADGQMVGLFGKVDGPQMLAAADVELFAGAAVGVPQDQGRGRFLDNGQSSPRLVPLQRSHRGGCGWGDLSVQEVAGAGVGGWVGGEADPTSDGTVDVDHFGGAGGGQVVGIIVPGKEDATVAVLDGRDDEDGGQEGVGVGHVMLRWRQQNKTATRKGSRGRFGEVRWWVERPAEDVSLVLIAN